MIAATLAQHLGHFNSIKVRLEQLTKYELLQARDQFQFHKGTIRT